MQTQNVCLRVSVRCCEQDCVWCSRRKPMCQWHVFWGYASPLSEVSLTLLGSWHEESEPEKDRREGEM